MLIFDVEMLKACADVAAKHGLVAKGLGMQAWTPWAIGGVDPDRRIVERRSAWSPQPTLLADAPESALLTGAFEPRKNRRFRYDIDYAFIFPRDLTNVDVALT